MRKKLVLWGNDALDKKILVGLELDAEENKVNIYTLPESAVDEEISNHWFKVWRDDDKIGTPHEAASKIERPLTVSDAMLPNEIKTENTQLINRAQTEWHFVVLSNKLSRTYEQEIDQLKDRVKQLESFDNNVWDELKGFWSKVQGQIREKNLFNEHGRKLKELTNGLFEDMKTLRKRLDDQFKEKSKENKTKFQEILTEVEEKVTKGIRLDGLFEELKEIQKNFRDSDLVRKDRNDLWDKIDGLFKAIKEKRFGDSNSGSHSPNERIVKRQEGLKKAIDRMRNSIRFDEKEFKYNQGREGKFTGQLEKQLSEAKMKMITERIESKKAKFEDMLKTMASLEKKLEKIKEKEEIRNAKEAAKKEAEAKIKAEITKNEAAHSEDKEKLEKAAAKIKETKAKKQTKAKAKVQPDSAEDKLSSGAAEFSTNLHLSLKEEQ